MVSRQLSFRMHIFLNFHTVLVRHPLELENKIVVGGAVWKISGIVYVHKTKILAH